jgi:hypothetical protein
MVKGISSNFRALIELSQKSCHLKHKFEKIESKLRVNCLIISVQAEMEKGCPSHDKPENSKEIANFPRLNTEPQYVNLSYGDRLVPSFEGEENYQLFLVLLNPE